MNYFNKVTIVLTTNCTIYTMSYNFVIHATCLLKVMVYKYNELQMFGATKKLNCKASCKTPIFLIMWGHLMAVFHLKNVIWFEDLDLVLGLYIYHV
jgi:hypothetical protein